MAQCLLDPAPFVATAHYSTKTQEEEKKPPVITQFVEAWPIVGSGEDTKVFYESQGFPIVVFKQYGNGGLLVIGDSSFLLDKNLETQTTFMEGNILFLRRIFTELEGEGVPK